MCRLDFVLLPWYLCVTPAQKVFHKHNCFGLVSFAAVIRDVTQRCPTWFKSEKFVHLGRVNPRYQSVLEAADVIVGTSVLRKHRLCVCQIKFFCKFLCVFIFVVVKNFSKCFFQDQDGSRIPVAR